MRIETIYGRGALLIQECQPWKSPKKHIQGVYVKYQ